MQPRPEGGLWAAARLVRSEPRHCRWRGAKLRLRAGLQRALGRLSLGLSRGRCLVSQMVVSDREPFPHTAQSTFWSRGLWAALRLCVPPIVRLHAPLPGRRGDPHRASCLYPVESVQRTTRYTPRRAGCPRSRTHAGSRHIRDLQHDLHSTTATARDATRAAAGGGGRGYTRAGEAPPPVAATDGDRLLV